MTLLLILGRDFKDALLTRSAVPIPVRMGKRVAAVNANEPMSWCGLHGDELEIVDPWLLRLDTNVRMQLQALCCMTRVVRWLTVDGTLCPTGAPWGRAGSSGEARPDPSPPPEVS